jgi:hypothetical protein
MEHEEMVSLDHSTYYHSWDKPERDRREAEAKEKEKKEKKEAKEKEEKEREREVRGRDCLPFNNKCVGVIVVLILLVCIASFTAGFGLIIAKTKGNDVFIRSVAGNTSYCIQPTLSKQNTTRFILVTCSAV